MAHREHRRRLTILAAWVVGAGGVVACTRPPSPPDVLTPTTTPVSAAEVHVHAGRGPTLADAIAAAVPGTTIVIHGEHALREPLQVSVSGRADAWISLVGASGARAVLDGSAIDVAPPSGKGPQPHDDGVLTLRGASYVRVRHLEIRESHAAGIVVNDSTDVEIADNVVVGTFGPGIAAWDHDPALGACERIRIVGNTVRETNDVDRAPPWFPRHIEPPHEAISLGGVVDFEVAYNEVADARKEGIDVKEVSARGRVHHNHVHDAARQCLYVDAWFGRLSEIEIDHNLAERCLGAGIAIAVEGKSSVAEGVDIHDNLVRDNAGSGVLLARFGGDGPRRDIRVHHNTITGNGGGPGHVGGASFWIPGGVFLWSANVEQLAVTDNRILDNHGFQLGLADAWFEGGAPLPGRITVSNNAISGERPARPIVAGGDKRVLVREWVAEEQPPPRDEPAVQGADLDPAAVGPAAARATPKP